MADANSDPHLNEGDLMPPGMGPLTQDTLVTCILMGIIALVGLVGNSLMLRAYIKYPKLRTDFYTVFCSLAIADSIFLCVAVPRHIRRAIVDSERYEFDGVESDSVKLWCRVSQYLMDACGFVAAYLIVVLSVLRAILLTNRNTGHQPRALHLVLLSVVFYVLAFVTSYPIINTPDVLEDMCRPTIGEAEAVKMVWLKSLFSLFLPLGLVVVIHLTTYMLGKRFFSDSYSPREREKSRLVIAVIIAFAICQFPYRVVSIYITYMMQRLNLEGLDNTEEAERYEEWERLEKVKSYLSCLFLVDKVIRPILLSKLASDVCDAFDEVINCVYCSRSYHKEPLYDQPVGQAVGDDDQPTDQIPDGAAYMEAPDMESQKTLVETVEVHRCEGNEDVMNQAPGCVYDDSTPGLLCNGASGHSRAPDCNGANGHASAVESLCSRSCERLISTSSTASAASTSSQTPLMGRRQEEEQVEMI